MFLFCFAGIVGMREEEEEEVEVVVVIEETKKSNLVMSW
jgi:hypothetical protein